MCAPREQDCSRATRPRSKAISRAASRFMHGSQRLECMTMLKMLPKQCLERRGQHEPRVAEHERVLLDELLGDLPSARKKPFSRHHFVDDTDLLHLFGGQFL